MAKAKTGSFYLTETVTLAAAAADGSRASGTIDLGAYVNVPTGQAIAIDQVDFIHQAGTAFTQHPAGMVSGNCTLSAQLTDLNPGTAFVRADNQSLIASSALNIDVINNVTSQFSDIFPDNFGAPSTLSEAFMVVNDQLYLTIGNNGAAISGTNDLEVTARVRARVVKLSSEDWMAIAIQSTASDN